MSWFYENQRYWRIPFLLLLILAISGPWFFDRIFVPALYTCSAPNIRLNEDFCGIPLSITWFYSNFLFEFRDIVANLVAGTTDLGTLRILLFLFLPFLPILNNLVLMLRKEHRLWQIFQITTLGLVAFVVTFYGLMGISTASWVLWNLWGLWLYIVLTLIMLLYEIWMFKVNRRLVYE